MLRVCVDSLAVALVDHEGVDRSQLVAVAGLYCHRVGLVRVAKQLGGFVNIGHGSSFVSIAHHASGTRVPHGGTGGGFAPDLGHDERRNRILQADFR